MYLCHMRIISFKRIQEFHTIHPASKIAIQDWYHKVSKKEWDNLSDIKLDFNSVDYVGNSRFIFNVKGNHYRVVCIIIFASKKVYIRFIGTHQQYDKIDVSTI